MNTQPHIGELVATIDEPIPGRRFCIARDVPLVGDELGRDHVTQYLHRDGRWHPWCWMENEPWHGYYTRQEANETLASILYGNEA